EFSCPPALDILRAGIGPAVPDMKLCSNKLALRPPLQQPATGATAKHLCLAHHRDRDSNPCCCDHNRPGKVRIAVAEVATHVDPRLFGRELLSLVPENLGRLD